jgi:hypothetical protein
LARGAHEFTLPRAGGTANSPLSSFGSRVSRRVARVRD